MVVESMLIFPGTLVKIIIFFCQMNHLNLNLSQVQSIWTGTFSRSESCSVLRHRRERIVVNFFRGKKEAWREISPAKKMQ